MKIIHHRQTRHFVALLVRCQCGRKFLHRFDRALVACFRCGRVDDMARLVGKLRAAREAERRRMPRAARRSHPRG